MSGTFDKGLVNQIQQANDIVDVISEHVSLAKKGREMVGLCPFHDDHRPSMYVNPVKQIFKCFACGAGGSVFTFIQMRENLTFPQTIERLAQRAGIKLTPRKAPRDGAAEFADVDPNSLAKVNAWAAAYFQQNLNNPEKGKSALDYITQRRITPESARKWQIGLAIDSSDDLIRTAARRKIPENLLAQAGLVVGQKGAGFTDKFVNRLIFPISDVTARVIGFGGRTLDGAGAKYINSPTTVLFDKSNSIYGLQHARHQIAATGAAVVVEGYTDCIMAHQFGCANVVAALGTSFTEGHARIIRRYAKKVILLFDSDAAGLEAANRALEICLAQRIDIKLASVPEGKDPCDFLLSAGKERFEQLIDQAVDVFQFKWNRLVERFTTGDMLMDHKAAVEEFLQAIAIAVWAGNLPPVDRGLIVNRLSRIVGLDARQINQELGARVKRAARTAAYTAERQKPEPLDLGKGFFAVAQREILEVLLNEPKLFAMVEQKVTPDLFDVHVLRQIADLLFETLRTDPKASLADVLAGVESPRTGGVIVELARAGELKANFQSRLTGALDAVLRYQAQEKKSQIRAIDDQRQFLQSFLENTGKQNPHNLGMV
ncbi:MAG TPA: DNA primase [Sedimentisphaerales bacterium]|nr:DNA primase [Sedimentisphaerales bacterium]